jgi:hypothetical protein
MSKLIVEIVKISELLPIEKADRLELAIVKGWQGIQELIYGLDDIEFRIFDVKYKGRYLNEDEKRDVISDWINENSIHGTLPLLLGVPVLFRGNYNDGDRKHYAKGNSTIPGAENQIREGCVIKPIVEREQRPLGRVILKSINPEYLLQKNRTEFH